MQIARFVSCNVRLSPTDRPGATVRPGATDIEAALVLIDGFIFCSFLIQTLVML